MGCDGKALCFPCFSTVKKAVLGRCPLAYHDMGYEFSPLLHIRFGVLNQMHLVPSVYLPGGQCKPSQTCVRFQGFMCTQENHVCPGLGSQYHRYSIWGWPLTLPARYLYSIDCFGAAGTPVK